MSVTEVEKKNHSCSSKDVDVRSFAQWVWERFLQSPMIKLIPLTRLYSKYDDTRYSMLISELQMG